MWLQKSICVSSVLIWTLSLFLISAGFASNLHAGEYELPYVLEFDGSGDYVDLPVRPRDIDGDGVTFSCWIKIAPGTGGDRMKILSGFSGRDGANRWDFEYNEAGDRQLGFNEWGGTGSNPGNRALEEDTWYFVSFTWEPGEEAVLYIDGEKDAELNISNSTLDDGEKFRIAGRPDGSEKEWEGSISDATLWQGILTQEEIREEMDTPPAGDEEGLVGSWAMDEGEDNTVYDKSPGENHGSITGASWGIAVKPSELLAEPAEKVLPVLIEVAEKHASTSVRRQAVSGLAILDVDADAIQPVLLEILEDSEDADEVRLTALEVLHELENVEGRELMPVLLGILENTDETDEIRLEVLGMLGSLYNTAQDKVSTLLNVIENPEDSQHVRLEALELLSVMDFAMDRISPVLLEVLKEVEDTEEVPVEIVRFLQRKEQEEVLEEALPALGDALTRHEDRGVAIALLNEIGSEEALTLLENIVDVLVQELDDDDPSVRRQAIQHLDEVGWEGKPDVFMLDGAVLFEVKHRIESGYTRYDEALEKLREDADAALAKGPFSVTDKDGTPPSEDPHDYMSIGPFWWPNPDTEDGLPYVRRDGEVNPERDDNTFDRVRLSDMTNSVVTLSLAYYFTEYEPYAEHASRLLRKWFLDPDTKMNPHMEYAQAIPGRVEGRGIGIIDTWSWVDLIDAVGMIEHSEHWSESDKKELQAWFSEYVEWLKNSSKGRAEQRHHNNHGTWYDAQIVAYMLFSDKMEMAREQLQEWTISRISDHFRPDGRQPRELDRTQAWSYSNFNLEAYCAAGRLGRHVGIDVLGYETNNGRSVRQGIDYLLQYVDRMEDWSHKEIHGAEVDRLARRILPTAVWRYDDEKYYRGFEHMEPEKHEQSRLRLKHPYLFEEGQWPPSMFEKK